ncbi:olfactory receptor 52K1-like [Dendrobates tinctorius]|uniref:olfactory receptor 52K1-like n=1 Tax=Dendrobates tinctorius TaxID=92724 RepID=UPI003CC9AE58
MEASGLNKNVSLTYTEFILLPFPGVTLYRKILVVPFFMAYSLILATNLLIPFIIWWERNLHAPMYILIGLLLIVNVISTTTVIPQMLLSFLGQNRIFLSSCFAQMFFVYSAIMFKSVVFLLMAFDRFVAICHPLRYNDIINRKTLLQLWMAGLTRNCILVSLVVFFASRVQYCKSNLIQNFVCEFAVLLNLACGDISRTQLVGLMIRTGVTVSDVSLLLVCYLRVLNVALKIAMGSSRRKALHTCGTHLLVALTVYSCGFLSFIFNKVEESISPDSQNLSSVIYFLLPATLNPIMYGFGVKEIKDCLVKNLMSNIRGQQTMVSHVV